MNRQEAFEAWWSGLDGNYECYGEENHTKIAKNAWQAAWKARGEQDAKLCDLSTATLSETVQHNRDLMDENEAADFLSISPGTLSVWRSTGRYAVPFVKVGRRVRYRRTDLEAWLESRTRANGATA